MASLTVSRDRAVLEDYCEDYTSTYRYDELFGFNGMHCHDFYEMYIHFGGGESICIDEQLHTLVPNQLLIIPPFRLHGLTGASVPSNYERGYLYITSSSLKAAGCGQLDIEQFLTSRTNHGNYSYILSDQSASVCKELLKRISADKKQPGDIAKYCAFTHLTSFLSEICECVNASLPLNTHITINATMQNVLSYLNANFNRSLRLDDVAKRFGISTSLLSHEFVKFTGRSVYDYALYCRIRLAKELIYSSVPLGDTAYQCGFNDYSTFLRAFTKITGMSPSAYKKHVSAQGHNS